MNQQVKVQLNYLHVAPRKVRLIANTLKKLSVQEAEAQLLIRPQRANKPLLKLLRSAVANAKNNNQIKSEELMVADVIVNEGPMLKRFLPRAQGRATPIHKKMSHVTLILEKTGKVYESRFIINPPEKKKRDESGKKIGSAKKVERENKSEKAPQKQGFFKRLFKKNDSGQ